MNEPEDQVEGQDPIQIDGPVAPTPSTPEEQELYEYGGPRDEVETRGLSAANRAKVSRYAKKHWKNYNKNYRRFGQDCTNFASQALRAGGWKHKTGYYKSTSAWWYNRLNQSRSWVNAEYFYQFALKKSKRTSMHSSPGKLRTGDILQYRTKRDKAKSHTMITTGRKKGQPLLTYHTRDTLNKPLSQIRKPNRILYPHKV
nr:amidase domain-containing protein [Nocardiopsis mwathae]